MGCKWCTGDVRRWYIGPACSEINVTSNWQWPQRIVSWTGGNLASDLPVKYSWMGLHTWAPVVSDLIFVLCDWKERSREPERNTTGDRIVKKSPALLGRATDVVLVVLALVSDDIVVYTPYSKYPGQGRTVKQKTFASVNSDWGNWRSEWP